jgi:nucleotide-binding universal stress UspA family protein
MREPFPTDILLNADGSEGAPLAARAAVDLSKRAATELRAAYDRRPPPHNAHPSPAPEILDLRGQIGDDLIVVGSRGSAKPRG